MSTSIFWSKRYSARPGGPPKPPTRTGTGGNAGAVVRPASETVTARSARLARLSASCRASVVPPRMRTRMSRVDLLSPQSAALRRWLSIVGIGEDGVDALTPVARRLIGDAEIVFGGKRHLALASALIRGAARAWPSPFDRPVDEALAPRGRPLSALPSADP